MKPKKSNEYTSTWVAPEYKKLLKAEAALSGQSIFEYTRSQAQQRLSELKLSRVYEKDEVEKTKFRFGL